MKNNIYQTVVTASFWTVFWGVSACLIGTFAVSSFWARVVTALIGGDLMFICIRKALSAYYDAERCELLKKSLQLKHNPQEIGYFLVRIPVSDVELIFRGLGRQACQKMWNHVYDFHLNKECKAMLEKYSRE